MSEKCFAKVAVAVSKMTCLTALSLRSVYCEAATSIQTLAESLACQSNLQQLQLGWQWFSSPVASVLLPVLAQKHTGLCHLDLRLPDYLSKPLPGSPFWGLGDLTQLTFLCLPVVDAAEQHSVLQEFGRALPHLLKLQHLDMSGAGVSGWCSYQEGYSCCL